MSYPMRPVRAAAPVAPWIGGKRNLAQRLVRLIETIDHDLYAEPFCGMGGVFLRRDRAPAIEVLNDVSRDVANLFRVLQRHYVAFLEMMRFQVTARAEFERLAATDPETLTDMERAARFLYLQRTAYGGNVVNRTFGVSTTSPARFDVTRLQPLLEAVHERLAGVVIECLPWDAFLDRYDRKGALFYLDPPYYGSEDDYGRRVFRRQDFRALARRLAALEGTFVLSINDRPEVREIFGAFELETVATTYTIASGPATAAAELIVTPPGLARRSAGPLF